MTMYVCRWAAISTAVPAPLNMGFSGQIVGCLRSFATGSEERHLLEITSADLTYSRLRGARTIKLLTEPTKRDKGSWWSDPQGKEIFQALGKVTSSRTVLVAGFGA